MKVVTIMKKRFIIAMLLLCSLLCACAKENTSAPASSTSERTIPESSTPEPPTSEGSTPTGLESPESHSFSSYEELASFVIPREAQMQSANNTGIPNNYKAALSQMIAKGIPIPCKGGNPIHLQNQSKHNKTKRISLLSRLSFSAPGFFYYTTSNNVQIWIKLSLEQDISSTFTDEDFGSEIVRALNPNANNLHNAEERTDDYSYIGERIITTSNGEKNALYKMGTDNREYYTFMQNGYVVELFAKPDVLTDEWFEDFSIELMPVSDTSE